MKQRQKIKNSINKTLAVLSLLILPLLISQAESETKEKKKENFQFSGDSTSITLKEGEEKTILKGNAKIISGATEIKADLIEISGEKFEFAECSNNITVRNRDKGLFISCNKLNFDRKKNISIITGFVEMIDKKNNLVVRGYYLQDNGDSDITLIQFGVRIFKDDITCRSEFARFNRKTKELELTGTPEVTKGGDLYKAKRIILNTETNEIKLQGSASGEMAGEEEE